MAEVFISWSGDVSLRVAKALRGWLPKVLQGVTPWMSTDISAGERWNDILHGKLLASNVGVLCLTKENLKAPWLLFEAGALAKHLTKGRVIPYRFQLTPEDIATFSPPLSQFHSVSADETGTLEPLDSIMGSLRDWNGKYLSGHLTNAGLNLRLTLPIYKKPMT